MERLLSLPVLVSYKLATSITNRSGWGNTARAAAASYSGFTDPDRGEIRFRYRDRTGTNRSEQVLAKAQNLGGPDAHGAITLGRAWWWYDCMSYCKLSYAELAATTNSNVTWNVNAGSSYTVPAGSYDLQSILAHEFGHTAGGRHPTCGPRSTHNMQAFFEAGERRLPGTHDRNMILYMYAGHNDAKYGPRVAPVTC